MASNTCSLQKNYNPLQAFHCNPLDISQTCSEYRKLINKNSEEVWHNADLLIKLARIAHYHSNPDATVIYSIRWRLHLTAPILRLCEGNMTLDVYHPHSNNCGLKIHTTHNWSKLMLSTVQVCSKLTYNKWFKMFFSPTLKQEIPK